MSVTNTPPATVTNPLAVALVLGANRFTYAVARRWLETVNAVLFLFAALPMLAPLARASGLTMLANGIYAFEGWFCHQRDDRSFHLAGEKLACCHRCSAIYLGTLLAGIAYLRFRHRMGNLDRRWWALLALPMAGDGLIQATGAYESTAVIRATTGALFGCAVAGLGMPYLDRGFADLRAQLETRFARLVANGRTRPLRGAPPVSPRSP